MTIKLIAWGVGTKTGICNDSQQESRAVAQKYWIGFEFFLMGSCMWASQGASAKVYFA